MRSMFSVVTPMIWVSPRSKIAEPCTRGSTSTSADSARMSARPRPSMRTLSRRMRWRMSFFCTERKAAETSFWRPTNWPLHPTVGDDVPVADELEVQRGLDLVERSSRSCLPAI